MLRQLLTTATSGEVTLKVADEIIHGPDGDVLVPAEVELLRADGFLLRRRDSGQVLIEILGPEDDQSRCRVIARLAFTNEAYQRFVAGLVTVTQDGSPRAGTQSSN